MPSKKPERNFVEIRTTLNRRGIRSGIIVAQIENYLAECGKLVVEIGGTPLRPGGFVADEAYTVAALDDLCSTVPAIAATVTQHQARDAALDPIRRRQAEVNARARRLLRGES